MKHLKTVGFLAFVALGCLIGFGRVFEPNLNAEGHLVLMMFIITIGMWILKPLNLPYSISSGLFMASAMAVGVPAANVFSGFSGSAVWTLIPALYFGFVLQKTGLGKRIAYFGMKSINVTYPSLLIMWTVIGVALSMLTPSITVRVIIVTPIALNCVRICKLPEKSNARSLILLTAWAMATIPGNGWMTGSLTGPIMLGYFSAFPELDGIINFSSWLKVSLLPVTISTAITLILSYFLLKPTEKLNLSKDAFAEEYEKLGKITQAESISAIALTLCFLMFVTASIHNIPTAAVCLFALFVLSASGVIVAKDISTGISWDLVLFIGTAMGLGSVFIHTGISSWISDIIVGAIAPVAVSPWVFVPVILTVMFLWRFIDIATYIPTMAIVSAIAPEVFARYNISPLVWIPMTAMAVSSFFLSYTNMFALVAESGLGDEGWTGSHLSKYGTAYYIGCMVSMLAAIPLWISMGLFG